VGFKTRVSGTPAQIGNTYKEEQKVSQFGAKRKASGAAQVPQSRSVDSMKSPAWKMEMADHPQLTEKQAKLIAKQEQEKQLRNSPQFKKGYERGCQDSAVDSYHPWKYRSENFRAGYHYRKKR
jgi:hypothetical protein